MSNRKLRFRAAIDIRGINPYVLVSAERAARLKPDWRKPMPVRIQVNGKPDVPWRINMMPAGDGSFFLYLHAQVRKESRTAVGDVVSVTIEFDGLSKGGPSDPMPSWFGQELRRNRKAQRGWDSLPPSRQKEIIRYLARLKSAQAQLRNVERALHVLAGGKARFMGRAWEAGR
jgi:Domain of unknown function (DUF1905)/Bacteriocin-protection, YdeI or OmpD-Associated